MTGREYIGNKNETIDRILSVVSSEHFAPFEAGHDFELETSLLDAKLQRFKLPSPERFTVKELLPYMTDLFSIIKADNSRIRRVAFEMDASNDIKHRYNLEDDQKLGRELSMSVTIFVAPDAKDESKYKLSVSTGYLREEKYDDKKRFNRENKDYNRWVKDTLSTVDACF